MSRSRRPVKTSTPLEDLLDLAVIQRFDSLLEEAQCDSNKRMLVEQIYHSSPGLQAWLRGDKVRLFANVAGEITCRIGKIEDVTQNALNHKIVASQSAYLISATQQMSSEPQSSSNTLVDDKFFERSSTGHDSMSASLFDDFDHTPEWGDLSDQLLGLTPSSDASSSTNSPPLDIFDEFFGTNPLKNLYENSPSASSPEPLDPSLFDDSIPEHPYEQQFSISSESTALSLLISHTVFNTTHTQKKRPSSISNTPSEVPDFWRAITDKEFDPSSKRRRGQ